MNKQNILKGRRQNSQKSKYSEIYWKWSSKYWNSFKPTLCFIKLVFVHQWKGLFHMFYEAILWVWLIFSTWGPQHCLVPVSTVVSTQNAPSNPFPPTLMLLVSSASQSSRGINLSYSSEGSPALAVFRQHYLKIVLKLTIPRISLQHSSYFLWGYWLF